MIAIRKVDRRLWVILGVAAIIIFWRLAHVDMVGDDAHYSVRALGLVDFMFATPEFQSTPLQWFTVLPWWAHLSFHDHPILLFLVQYLFLSIHESIWFAKLPFALMALGSLVITYFWMLNASKRVPVALLSTLLLALNAQFIWSARVSHLEAGVVFFLSLAIWTFWRFVQDKTRWLPFGVALGLAFLAKFTSVFLLPSIVVFLFLQGRNLFRSRELYFAAGVAFIINLPTILYNLFMYRATGHFALQFVRLLGEHSPWHMQGVRTGNFFHSVIELFQNLGQLVSWPYLIAFFVAVGIALYERSRLQIFLLICFAFLVVQHVFVGNGGNILTIFSLVFAPFMALTAVSIWERVKSSAARRRAALAIGIVFALYCFGFVVNSHILVRHSGTLGLGYSSLSSDNFGVYQLDQYLDTLIQNNGPWDSQDIYYTIKKVDPRLYRYITTLSGAERRAQAAHSRIILFDNSINWFARVWLFERRRFYHDLPFVGVQEQKLLDQLKIYHMYFIRATDKAPLDGVNDQGPFEVEKLFIAAGVKPVLIRRDDGEVAFKIYESDTTQLVKHQ